MLCLGKLLKIINEPNRNEKKKRRNARAKLHNNYLFRISRVQIFYTIFSLGFSRMRYFMYATATAKLSDPPQYECRFKIKKKSHAIIILHESSEIIIDLRKISNV